MEGSRFRGICAGAPAEGPDQNNVAQPRLPIRDSISFSWWGRGDDDDDNTTGTKLIKFITLAKQNNRSVATN